MLAGGLHWTVSVSFEYGRYLSHETAWRDPESFGKVLGTNGGFLTLGAHRICNGLRRRNGLNEVFCNFPRHGNKAWPQRFECLKHRPASNVTLTIGRKLPTMFIRTAPKRPYKHQECPVLASAFYLSPVGVLIRNPASGKCHCAHHASGVQPCLPPIF